VSRSARKIAEAVRSYRADASSNGRRGFEEGVRGALAILSSQTALPASTRDRITDAAISLLVDFVGGGWPKVRRALEEGAPELYQRLKDHLPSGSDLPLA
jgi:hypothetical protein